MDHETDCKMGEKKKRNFPSEFFPYPVLSLLDGESVLAEELREESGVFLCETPICSFFSFFFF